MSHQIQFCLWILDDQNMKWLIVRSCDLNELLSMRRQMIDAGVECTTIKKEKIR